MIHIIPNLFEQTKEDIERRIHLVAPYVETIQIDIADQTLVPLKTVTDFGFLPGLKCLQTLEAHLMVNNPETYVTKLVRSGFTRIIGHIECTDPREFLAEARSHECEVGLAIDLETPLEQIEPFLEELDCVQVMAVQVGPTGQLFEESSLSKIKAIHRNLPDLPIAVEGGMTPETVQLVADAGATRILSTSFLYKDDHSIAEAIQKLEEAGG